SLSAAVEQAAAGAAPKARRIGSLLAETIVLVDPARNYAQFLLRALLPMVIHVVIALAAGYAVGSEFRRRSMRTWLACAGGDPIVALAGKLAPLFAIFVVIMLALPFSLEGYLGVGFKGDVPMMVAAASLLIIGYLALGALMQLLVRDLATGLGLTSLVVSPAFGYAGVGFPTFGMNSFSQIWSAILPVRWYMAVLLGQAARGLPLADSAGPFAALAASFGGAGGVCHVLFSLGHAPPALDREPGRFGCVGPAAGPRRDDAARHRRRLCDRMAARARASRRFPHACDWTRDLRYLLP